MCNGRIGSEFSGQFRPEKNIINPPKIKGNRERHVILFFAGGPGAESVRAVGCLLLLLLLRRLRRPRRRRPHDVPEMRGRIREKGRVVEAAQASCQRREENSFLGAKLVLKVRACKCLRECVCVCVCVCL